MKKCKFTLIELMIVVAIIAIIATIAVPQLMSARRNSNEKNAMGSLRSCHTDQESYLNDNASYATLAQLSADGKVSLPAPASGSPKAGYYYSDIITVPTADFYASIASPSAFAASGGKHFAITNEGKVRMDTASTTTMDDTATASQANVSFINSFDSAR